MEALNLSNEVLFFIQLFLCFAAQIAAYKWFGVKGLFAWIVFATIICNIETAKTVEIFGCFTVLGNILYGSTFLATDILSEKYGGKVARRSILLALLASAFFVVFIQLSLAYIPSEFDEVNGPMHQVFAILPRLLVASLVTFAISNTLDTYSYELFRKLCPKQLWIRNNGSTITSQLVDTALFSFLAFWGMYPKKEFLVMCLVTWAFKCLVAVFDTPFIYLAKRITPSDEKKAA